MQMDDLVRDGKPQTWLRAGSTTTAERRIAAISGNTITVDVPLSDSFDSKYLGRSGTAVVRIRPPARVSQVGLEKPAHRMSAAGNQSYAAPFHRVAHQRGGRLGARRGY